MTNMAQHLILLNFCIPIHCYPRSIARQVSSKYRPPRSIIFLYTALTPFQCILVTDTSNHLPVVLIDDNSVTGSCECYILRLSISFCILPWIYLLATIQAHHSIFIFSCDQAAVWMVQSVCPSVCLSVTPFWLCSHYRIITKFSGVITYARSDVHAKGHDHRSKVKFKEVTTQLNRFRTVTPVWIHIWWWNDAYTLVMLSRGALLFFKVIRQISRSHYSKKRRIWPWLGVFGL